MISAGLPRFIDVRLGQLSKSPVLVPLARPEIPLDENTVSQAVADKNWLPPAALPDGGG
jgi:hypothetical protein